MMEYEFELDDFEFEVDDVIVNRGWDYFENGHVWKVMEIAPGTYKAKVRGSEIYTVDIELDDTTVVDYDCDCPYDAGSVCKHIVAVLYSLREQLEDEDDDDFPEPIEKRKQDKISDTELLDKVLEDLNTEELRDFIREQSKKNSKFRNILISRYASRVLSISKEFYSHQIAAIFDSFIGNNKYIPYSQTDELLLALSSLEQHAQKEMESKNYRNVLFFVMAMHEEVWDKLYYINDRSGVIKGFLTFGDELLKDLSEKDLEEEFRKELLKFVVSALKPFEFRGMDSEYTRGYVAISLIRTQEEKEQLRKILNRLMSSYHISEYQKKSVEKLVLDFIAVADGEGALFSYLESKPENTGLRKELIEKSISEGDYEKALELAEEGIKQDQNKAPRLIIVWQRYKLKIYRQMNDLEKAVQLARYMFIHASKWNKEEDYYKVVKKMIPAAEWDNYVEGLIDEVKNKHHSDYNLLTDIYIREERWEDFLEYVYNWPSFMRIAHAEKYMAKIYPSRLADMYKECVWADLQNTSDREHYREMAFYIERMINLGAKEQARKLIEDLKKEYPRRKAMIEELDKVIRKDECVIIDLPKRKF